VQGNTRSEEKKKKTPEKTGPWGGHEKESSTRNEGYLLRRDEQKTQEGGETMTKRKKKEIFKTGEKKVKEKRVRTFFSCKRGKSLAATVLGIDANQTRLGQEEKRGKKNMKGRLVGKTQVST